MSTRSWNRVELIGNLTRDPELRYTPQGNAVVTFSVATNRTFISEGEKKEEADFHRVVAWNKLAELCSQLLKKGNKVFISGRLQNRSWEGADGQTRYTTEIVTEDMILLTSKNGSMVEGSYDETSGQTASYQPKSRPEPKLDEEKVPEKNEEEEKQQQPGKEPEKPEEKKKDEEKVPEKPVKEEVEDLDDLPF